MRRLLIDFLITLVTLLSLSPAATGIVEHDTPLNPNVFSCPTVQEKSKNSPSLGMCNPSEADPLPSLPKRSSPEIQSEYGSGLAQAENRGSPSGLTAPFVGQRGLSPAIPSYGNSMDREGQIGPIVSPFSLPPEEEEAKS